VQKTADTSVNVQRTKDRLVNERKTTDIQYMYRKLPKFHHMCNNKKLQTGGQYRYRELKTFQDVDKAAGISVDQYSTRFIPTQTVLDSYLHAGSSNKPDDEIDNIFGYMMRRRSEDRFLLSSNCLQAIKAKVSYIMRPLSL
jgi:hypothetical protein